MQSGALVILLCLCCGLAVAAGEDILMPPISGLDTLASWRAGVAQADARTKPLTIACFGDSNTEAPTYTVALRELLQGCYGDRGTGYFTFSSARSAIPRGPEAKYEGNWQYLAEPTGPQEPCPPPYYAMDGYWCSSEDAKAALSVQFPAVPGNAVHRVRLHYQVGPGLGAFSLFIGNWERARIDCAADKPGYAVSEPFYAEQFKITHLTGKVILFGCDFDRRKLAKGENQLAGGALVYAFGHGWGMARHRAPTDAQAFSAFFAATKPDLVTILFGTNDMHNDGRPAMYRQAMTELVTKIQRAAPGVGILIITCPEAGQTREGAAEEFAAVAKAVAAANQCACWDWRVVMGPHSRPAEQQGWMADSLHYGPVGGSAFVHLLLRQLGFDLNDPRHWTTLRHAPETSGHQQLTVVRLKALDLANVATALKNEPTHTCWSLERKAADTQFAVAGNALTVHACVYDQRCLAGRDNWNGSNLDVYVSKVGSYAGDEQEKFHGHHGIVRQLVIMPNPDGTVKVSGHDCGQDIPAPAITARVTPLPAGGYELSALIPLSFFLLDETTAQFYLESAVVVAPGPGAPPAFCRLFQSQHPDNGAFCDNTQVALVTVK